MFEDLVNTVLNFGRDFLISRNINIVVKSKQILRKQIGNIINPNKIQTMVLTWFIEKYCNEVFCRRFSYIFQIFCG